MNKIFHYGFILFIFVGLIFNKQEALLNTYFKYLFMEWFIKSHSGFKYGESFKFSI